MKNKEPIIIKSTGKLTHPAHMISVPSCKLKFLEPMKGGSGRMDENRNNLTIKITNNKGNELTIDFSQETMIASGDLKMDEASKIFFESVFGHYKKLEKLEQENNLIFETLEISKEYTTESLIDILKDWKRSDDEFTFLVNRNSDLEQEKATAVEALETIAVNKVINSPECRTEKCKTSIGICFECRLKQCNETATQALEKLRKESN